MPWCSSPTRASSRLGTPRPSPGQQHRSERPIPSPWGWRRRVATWRPTAGRRTRRFRGATRNPIRRCTVGTRRQRYGWTPPGLPLARFEGVIEPVSPELARVFTATTSRPAGAGLDGSGRRMAARATEHQERLLPHAGVVLLDLQHQLEYHAYSLKEIAMYAAPMMTSSQARETIARLSEQTAPLRRYSVAPDEWIAEYNDSLTAFVPPAKMPYFHIGKGRSSGIPRFPAPFSKAVSSASSSRARQWASTPCWSRSNSKHPRANRRHP